MLATLATAAGAGSSLTVVSGSTCSWCGTHIEADDGFRVAEPAGERVAAFCRLEHVVPWAMQGAHWEPGRLLAEPTRGLGRCAWCADPLDDAPVFLVRHRGEHRIGDAFCTVTHLSEWAKAGGRWRTEA